MVRTSWIPKVIGGSQYWRKGSHALRSHRSWETRRKLLQTKLFGELINFQLQIQIPGFWKLISVTEADLWVSRVDLRCDYRKVLCTSRTVTWEKVKRGHGHTRPERRTRADAHRGASARKRAQARTGANTQVQPQTDPDTSTERHRHRHVYLNIFTTCTCICNCFSTYGYIDMCMCMCIYICISTCIYVYVYVCKCV